LSILPPKLPDGGTIGIVSPASPMLPDRLANGEKYLRSKGYNVKLGAAAKLLRGYLAGSDQQRADDINRMFSDPDIDAIFCSRGGYGSPRILNLIDYKNIFQNPKPFVGYSDITALQWAIFAKTGLITFSGPMVAVEMAKKIPKLTEEMFWPLLKTQTKLLISHKKLEVLASFQEGAEGRLIAGNLSLITSLLGTPFFPNIEGCVLAIEDIGEELYQVDRELTQLKNAGIFSKLRGLIIADFGEVTDDAATADDFKRTLREIASEFNLGIMFGLPYGHIDEKFTLPIGFQCKLDFVGSTLEVFPDPLS